MVKATEREQFQKARVRPDCPAWDKHGEKCRPDETGDQEAGGEEHSVKTSKGHRGTPWPNGLSAGGLLHNLNLPVRQAVRQIGRCLRGRGSISADRLESSRVPFLFPWCNSSVSGQILARPVNGYLRDTSLGDKCRVPEHSG